MNNEQDRVIGLYASGPLRPLVIAAPAERFSESVRFREGSAGGLQSAEQPAVQECHEVIDIAGYAALPTEVNSGLMYAGPGSGPHTGRCSGLDALATELYSEDGAIPRHRDLGPDHWVVGSVIDIDGGCRRAVCVVDVRHCRASRGDRRSGQGGGGRLRRGVCRDGAPAGDCGQSRPVNGIDRDELLGQNMPAIMATEAHGLACSAHPVGECRPF